MVFWIIGVGLGIVIFTLELFVKRGVVEIIAITYIFIHQPIISR